MKTKLLLLTSLYCSSMALFGQRDKKWHIGLVFSPDLCYRSLKNSTGEADIDALIKQRNKDEVIKIGFTTGIQAKYALKSRISLECGLLYSNKGYKLQMPIRYGTSTTSGNFLEISYNHKYLDLPLKINFIPVRRNKTSWHVTTGVVVNVFLQQKNVFRMTDSTFKTYVTNTKGEPFQSNKPLDCSVFGGMGFNTELKEKLSLQVELLYRYGLLKIYDATVRGYLWNIGFNLGIYYRL